MKHLSPVEKQASIVLELIPSLEDNVAKGIPLDRALRNIFRAHREYGSRDRSFFSALSFAYFRWLGWIIELPIKERIIASWLLDDLSEHPAIKLLMQQSKCFTFELEHCTEKNTLFEKAIWLKKAFPSLSERMPSQLLPEWCIKELFIPEDISQQEHILNCIKSFQKRVPTWFRSRAIMDVNSIIQQIKQFDYSLKQHPQLTQAMYLENPKKPDTYCTIPQELLKDNAIVIQDVASQCVGMLCEPNPKELWWDACAGAGGKSLLLADLMKNECKIVATDIRAEILEEFKKRMLPSDNDTIKIYQHDAMQGPPKNMMFDGVLVDAPCSGSGTWHRAPDARWRTGEAAINQFTEMQQGLLMKVANYVKSGGKLVYSTCTIFTKENNLIIERFLQKRKDFSLHTIRHPLTGKMTEGTLYIWPWDGPCNGMFVAVMKKV